MLILVTFAATSIHAVADEDSNSHKPIGNYNYIEIGFASTTEANSNSFCAGAECYKKIAGSELTASLNFESFPHLLLSVSNTSQGASGANSNLTYSVGKLLIGVIGGFGSVDAIVSVSSLNASVLTCPNGSNVCQDILENGTDFGAMAKLWLGDEKNYNLGIAVDRYMYSPSSTNLSTSIFATWLPARHHSLSFGYNSTIDINGKPASSGGSIAYAYLF
jgi:hypothetical protein